MSCRLRTKKRLRHTKTWAERAPALAGFPSFTEEEGERGLEKGIGPEGETLRPPMHIYHISHEDAKVSWLRGRFCKLIFQRRNFVVSNDGRNQWRDFHAIATLLWDTADYAGEIAHSVLKIR